MQILQQKLGPEDAAQGGFCRPGDLQSERRRRRRYRHPYVSWRSACGRWTAGSISVLAVRWSPKDPETGRDQCRHLSYDDQRSRARSASTLRRARTRPSIARSGGRWASRCRSPPPMASIPCCFLVAATSLPKTECEYDYYSGINGAPVEVVHRRPHRTAAAGREPRSCSRLSLCRTRPLPKGRSAKFTSYYGRPSGSDALHAGRARPLPRQSNLDLRADGGRRRRTKQGCSGRLCAPPASGPTCEARRAGHPGRVVDPGGGGLGHHGGRRSSRCMRGTRRG